MATGKLLTSSPVLFIAALGLVVILLTKVYRVLTSPLSRIPGPAISKWTNLQLKVAVVNGERIRYVHALHERYGPIVRISPEEVSLADTTSAKAIYKIGSPFHKSNWYPKFTGGVSTSLFTCTDQRVHGTHRKLTSYNFSENWIKNLEPYIAQNTQLAVQRMQEEANRLGYFDIFKWFLFMATDVVGEASFGESFRMLELGKKNEYISDLEKVGQRGIFRTEFPLLNKCMMYMPFGPGKEVGRAVGRFLRYSEESIQRYWRQLRADPEGVKPTLLTKEYASVEDGTIPAVQLRLDAFGYIVAGTDTTALTATYAVWLLTQYPDLEQALIREVSKLPEGFGDEDLRQLNLLQNVLSETLRLRSPIGQSLPRVVPAGGAEFGGFFVPAGAIVGIQAWTMHRNPMVWSHPERFDPSRWDNPTKEMKDSFLPFGGGSRICIGMHFAQLELRHALANFYRTFESGVKLSTAEGFSDDDMVPMAFFLNPPKGKRCLVERRK